MDENYESALEQVLRNKNYLNWRKEHTNMFGKIFSLAFEDSAESAIMLTAALINIANRKFDQAIPTLNDLESIAITPYDSAAVTYFTGLNYECMGNEEKMIEYYDKLHALDSHFSYPLPFYPYYRTAKIAQKSSECSKAIHYFNKALSFYGEISPNKKDIAIASQIMCDCAAMCLYMHQYEKVADFLTLAQQYGNENKEHATYIMAVLYAVHGKEDECLALVNSLCDIAKENCNELVQRILAGSDLHYCVVPQDRTEYVNFWDSLLLHKNRIEKQISDGKVKKVQDFISERLSSTLPFAQRQLDCAISTDGETVTVFCKNYCIKTLMCEHEILFSRKPSEFKNWRFMSVKWFENYQHE
ncbi:MAG: hypothetical protein J6V09_07160 [Clostridia bacterium]|nr:hypothetical protein [Clostridia bacterium]